MVTIKEYLDYAELAQASYSDLNNGMSNTYLNQQYKEALISGDFTSIQATDFANRYTVLAVSNNPNGFSATLFTDKLGNKYLSIRGSDDIPDVDDDFWNGLVTGRVPPQYESLVTFFESLKSSGQITASDKVVVTGHSLGGALAQMLTATYSSYIDETYTYNSPGAKNLSIPVMEYQGQYYKDYYVVGGVVQGTLISKSLYDAYSAFSQNKNSMDGKVTSLYAQEGDELAAGLGGGIMGTIVPISITPQLLDVSNHRMKFLTNSLHIYNMLSSIAQTQDLDLLTSIMEHSTDDKILDVVKGAFGTALTGSAVDQAISLTKSYTGHANGLVDLYPKSPSQIASQAKGDKSILYALTKLNPFAIEGNLPAYTDIDPTNYSEKYLQDRAQYLYYLLDKTNRYDVDPTHTMNHFEDSGLGIDYTLEQTFSRSRILFGGEGYSTLNGGEYGDHLYGMGGADALNGNGGDDWIEGGEGADIIDGGAGKDVLIGGYTKDKVDAQSDMLKGGADFDTYISGNMDIISDSDGKGRVYFEGKLLTGGSKPAGSGCGTGPNGSDEYYGDGGVYRLSGNTLTFIKDGKILTFENYTKNQLSLTFTDNPADGGSCSTSGAVGGGGGSGGGSGSCPKPTNPSFNISFSLPSPSQSVGSGGGGSYHYSGGGGGGGGSVSHSSGGGGSVSSTPHTTPTPPAPIVECPNNPLYSSVGTGGGSKTSPIVLDLNRNGITSISLAASAALFDYDGDGIKENTAWLEGSDALLVNDINNDGIINNASELFGNYTKNSDGSIAKSGYQALIYYDTNSDGVVNASDTRFSELKLWIDANQDGVTDTGELKTLTEMGVTSLSLNSATPYIPTMEDTNTIIQETTFTDGAGEGVMRDVLFRYENNSTNTEGVYFDMDGNGIKEKMTTWTDPNQWMIVKDLNGDGKITSGREVVGNHMILSTGTTAADTIQALKTFDINHDGVVDAADNSGLAFWTDRNHDGLTDIGELEALGAAGAIQTIKLNPYQTLLSGYDGNHDGVINSNDALYNNLYIQTDSDESVTLYLPDNASARAMIAGYTGGESIQTSEGEKIIKTVLFYSGTSMNLNDTLEGTDSSETLQGSSRSETLRGMGGRDILDAGAGDDILEGGKDSDKLMGGAGNDTYLYSRGDGKDLIIDSAGSDTIRFSAGITRDDIIIKSNGADISIYLKDGTKPLSELTDQLIVKDWHTTSTVKTIVFSDGSSMDGRDIVTMFATDKNDTIYGTDNRETLHGSQGNDVLQGRGGNDTYLYGRGDGADAISDASGSDILTFGEGISADDLIIKVSADSNDLIIALKEEEKTFSELTDTITIKDWFNSNNRIETVTFSDGSTMDTALLIPLQGTDENDTTHLLDTASSITLDLQGGDDVVTTGSGNDTLIGGEGNDTLQGGAGDDTYVFNRGDGADTISDASGSDILTFGEGVSSSDLIAQVSGNDLIIALKEEGKSFAELSDRITISNWYNANNRIENISFADGSVTLSTTSAILGLISTEGDDVIIGTEQSEMIEGNRGNDTLQAGFGDDTYIFNRGDGADAISDASGSDILTFGEGISADDLIIKVSADSNDLIIALKEEEKTFSELTDTITIKDWFNSNNRIETVTFSDGSTMDMPLLIPLQGTDENDTTHLLDTASSITLDLQGGDDVVTTGSGNDTLIGGEGNDTLQGGAGDDTYVFNRGDGADTISDASGTDTLQLGEGISADDLIIQKSGNNVIVAIKEDGVEFANLADKITIKDWDNVNNNIEHILLSDGTEVVVNPIAQDAQAMKFDGVDDMLTLSVSTGMNASTALSLTARFSYNGMGTGDQSSSAGIIVSKAYTVGSASYLLYINPSGRIIFYVIDSGSQSRDTTVVSTTVLNTGQMYDVVGTYDKTTGMSKIYINGVFDSEANIGSFNIMQSSEPVRIGAYGGGYTGTRSYLNGVVSDVQIYNKALSETEVATIANGGVGSDALLAHYDFEGSAPLEDKSGNGHTASIQGNPTVVDVAYTSPIVFDLNGNGITSTSSESNNVYFDYNGSGLRERTGWIERGDALLAVDVNKDGVINDGSELFGDHTKLSDGSLAADGYAAMAQYDTNSDGKIDSSDAHFNDLLLWKDTNLDGQSSADELSTLAANGIKAIDLSSNSLDASENGNRISYETSFTTTNGTNGIVRDLWFKTASDDTIASQNGDIADAGSFSDSFDDFTTDSTLKIDAIESMRDSGISSLTLQSRYTGSGLDGASAQTVFEGVGYTGTLSNVWLKSDTLDTQYTYTGTLSDEVKILPSIEGQGNVINLQEAMNEKSELASSVSEFQTLSETGNLSDFEANIDSIIEEWALYDLTGESANATPPIVLDLDGDGVTSTSLAASSAYFDYDGDGRREHTAWADAGDALLSIDLDGDGIITHGAELFGNYTLKADGSKATDGYDAMAQYDTNGDNVLDASDAEFSRLRLWKDLNQNGKNDAGELSTLSEEGISALHLSRTDGTTFTQITEAGNTITQETNYTGTNGEGTVRDVWFSYDGTDTIAYSNLSDSDEKKIAIVENFYGKRLNSEERNSVEVIAEVLNQYNALRYDTIAKIITDKLYGEGFPNCQFLHDALNNTLGRVVGGAASTTETLLAVNLLAALLKREHVGVLSDIYPEYFSNPTIAGLLAQSNIFIGFEGGALIGHIGNRYFGTRSAESLDFSSLDGVRAYMDGGDDTILGSHGIDELVGGEGNDTLNGNGGNDVLDGGQGDDTLIGSEMQNVYRYAWGDGNDTIIDAGSEEYAPDTLRLSDLDISRVSIERVGDDMILHVRNEEGELLTPFDEAFGTITIKDGYTEGKIEHFYFKDTRYTFDEVLAYVPADTDYYFVQGDAHVTVDEKGGADTLHFGDGITPAGIIARIVGEDLIIGLAQEGRTFDTLSDKITILNYSGAIEQFTFQDGTTMDLDAMIELAQAHLMINGSDASDTFYGTAESEIFDGRAGDDTIYGEAGDDIYKFGLGDGHDTIIDTAGDDTILLKEGILAGDVTLSLNGDDLILSLSDGSRMRIVSWMNTEGRIEHIKDIQGTSADFSSIFKPIVENATAEGNEDNLVEGSLSVTDMSGTSLVYAVATDAINGTFEIDTDSGEWTYEPNANFNGDDSVVVSVTNGYGVATTSTIALNILSVNDAPSVDEENITVTLDHTLNVEGQVTANDVDGDTLSYTIETQASHGTLSVDENGKWTYSAVDGYKGEDSAVLSISDGNGGIVQQLLNFNTNANMSPEALAESTNTLQDIRVLSGEVGATDVDGDILTYIVSTVASHGILSVDENGTWNYAAADGYMGSDSAVITIDDGNAGIITQTLNFEVKVSAPILFNTTSNLLEDTSTMGTLSVDNPIGGALIYEILNTSTKGDFILNESGEWSYAPSENLNGDDSVTIKVTNTYGLSTTATFNLAIEAVNDIPVIFADELYTLKDIRIMNGTIEAHDVDEDVLTYAISTEASHGIFTIDENGDWNYEAEDGYMGTDSAVITVDDGNGGVVTKTLNFEVKVSVPTLSDSIINILEDSSTTGIFSVENPIGGALFYEVLGSSSKGDFTVNEDGEWSYAPNANLNGEDSVTIKVTNEYGLSTTSTVSFAIETVNDAPVLVEAPDTITLYAGASTTGSIQATDIDGDTLSYSVTTPDHGILSINENGEWNYTAEPYYVGQSSATVTVDDGNGGSVVATLNFTNLMTPDWQYSYAGETLTIEDNDGTDTVMMNTVSMNELTFIQEENNLRIDIKDQPDVILTDYFAAPANGVESIQTSEGNINLSKEKIGTSGSFINIGWGGNQNDLISVNAKNSYVSGGKGDDILFGNERNNTFLGDVGNDLLVGGEGNDTLYGGENDDILYGDNGNDTLSGDEGNDKLFGGKGNDTLLGGNGNDFLAGGEGVNTLSGGSGNDIYLVTKGNNKTTIDENISKLGLFGRWFGQNGGEDILKFGEGITKEDISFLMKGNDLLLQYGDNEFITINNQKSEANRIEKFELNDGSYLTNTDIDRIIQQLNAYSKDQGFHLKDNAQIQTNQALMNIVAAGWHTL